MSDSRVWIRALCTHGSPCVAWSGYDQGHCFAFWSLSDDEELLDLQEIASDEHKRAAEFYPDEPDFDPDYSVKHIRVAWAT